MRFYATGRCAVFSCDPGLFQRCRRAFAAAFVADKGHSVAIDFNTLAVFVDRIFADNHIAAEKPALPVPRACDLLAIARLTAQLAFGHFDECISFDVYS